MDMLQLYLDNENEYRARDDEKWREQTLALENLTIKLGELTSQFESLRQRGVFIDASNDSCVENTSNGELIMGSDDVISTVCDNCEGDSELESEEGENNVECSIEVSSLEPNSCCCEQVEIPTIVVQNSPSEFLTLTDESSMDFIGFSKYLEAIEDNFEVFELEPIKYYIESCFLYECSFLLKPCLLKRNEDKVILVFDTYD